MKKKYLILLASCAFLSSQAQNIGNFTSVQPTSQGPTLKIPSTHNFQVLIQAGDNLITGGGTMPAQSDFCGYVSQTNSSRQGVVCVNSEFAPGGVTCLDIQYDSTVGYWDMTNSQKVSFSGISFGTSINCSGGITPWRTMVTCEEVDYNLDLNFDGLKDQGWNIEINPYTKTAVDQNGDGTADKVWAMGRFKHENVCFTPDSAIVYQGEDNTNNGFLYKYVLAQKGKLGAGTLYALSVTGTTGTWIQIANSSNSDKNNCISLTEATAATPWDRVEDVEVGPDGKIYFTSTATGNVYRFNDNGTTVSNFETFVAQSTYSINYGTGTQNVVFSSCDNLAFDAQGNLWITQDGGGNFLWMVKPGHTTLSPQIEIFGVIPAGAEPTGITFTPDGEFMFLDIQHPNGSNNTAQTDVTGTSYTMDAEVTLVIARNEKWGVPAVGSPKQKATAEMALRSIYPNPVTDKLNFLIESSKNRTMEVEIFDVAGKKVSTYTFNLFPDKNNLEINIAPLAEGIYQIRMVSGDQLINGQFVKERE